MIAARKFLMEDIPMSLVELVHSYNTSCPSMCKYKNKRNFTYILSSAMLLEVLLKRILFSLKGKYAGVHKLESLKDSLDSEVKLRHFSKEEQKFLEIDHSLVRYSYESFMDYEIDESVVDGLFEYFLDLALQLGIK
jgi:hypothetical protein